MATFRDKNHQLGSTITGALRMSELLEEQVKVALMSISAVDNERIRKNFDTLKKTILKINEQSDEMKSIAYRHLDPDKPLAEIESTIKTENRAYKVLIIEDEELVAETTRVMLERRGFKVSVAATVDEARLSIQMNCPDIALLDLALPSFMEGLDVLRYLKANCGNAKCIVITKEDSEERLKEVQELAPDKIMIKPVPIDQLTAQLNAIVGGAR